jgi:HD-like signal output (HDOD) protein/DNA-binding CsgD family transcriptional regulator
MNHGVPSKQVSPSGDRLAVGRRPVARPELRSKAVKRSAHARKDPAPAYPDSSKTSALRRPASRTRRRAMAGPLTIAFEALDTFPALAEARTRLLSVIANEHHATIDVIAVVESDVALTTAVLRFASSKRPARSHVDTVARAVELLCPQAIQAIANRVRTFDFFGRVDIWDRAPERFRLHALATQRAADRIACATDYANRDHLAVTSLMHDVGKLVLINAYPGYPSQIHHGETTPEQRADRELRELGIDHALAGGVLLTRWGLPASLATTIERHHSPEAEGEAQIVRLADMLANYELGTRVSPSAMLQSARAIGLGPEKLRWLMHEPAGKTQRRRTIDPSPLTRQEHAVLQRLAKGSVYNQIAHDLALTASTIRSHLHHIYRKLNVSDRAQAVLVASERGWL